MGKYRFRLSDMMPNAWFYKLKDMGKSSRSTKSKTRVSNCVKQTSPTATQTTTKSSIITKFQHPKSSFVYYSSSAGPAEPLIRFTDPLYSSPRNYGSPSDARSSRKTKRTTIYKPKNENFCSSDQPFYYSLSSGELGNGSPECMLLKSNDCSRKNIDFGSELLMFDELGSWSSSSLRSSCSCSCRISSSTADIIIDLNHHHHHNSHEDSISRKFQKLNEFDALSELELRPILTKIPKEQSSEKTELDMIKKSNSKEKKSRRSSSLSDSFAIVKSSLDPQRDFQDSMMEMIEENNIRGFKDLEELLACYLSLNCKEYHPLIVKAFEEIWVEIFCCS